MYIGNKPDRYFLCCLVKSNEIHRGKLIMTVVKDKGVNVRKLMKQMGLKRGSYYRHIKKSDLSYEYIQRYGRYLNYDFSQDLPEMPIPTSIVEEDPTNYYSPDQLRKERDKWRDKFYELLERYNGLLEKMKTTGDQ